MIIYELRFPTLPTFVRLFKSQDELFDYIDTVDPSVGKYKVKVREIKDSAIKKG